MQTNILQKKNNFYKLNKVNDYELQHLINECDIYISHQWYL